MLPRYEGDRGTQQRQEPSELRPQGERPGLGSCDKLLRVARRPAQEPRDSRRRSRVAALEHPQRLALHGHKRRRDADEPWLAEPHLRAQDAQPLAQHDLPRTHGVQLDFRRDADELDDRFREVVDMNGLHPLAALARKRRHGKRGEQREQPRARPAVAVNDRRLHHRPVEVERREIVVGPALGAMETAARHLVGAQRRNLYDPAHAGDAAGVEQCPGRREVQRVEGPLAALANDSHRIDHGIDALEAREPVILKPRAPKPRRRAGGIG
jgi:hypothetical protein